MIKWAFSMRKHRGALSLYERFAVEGREVPGAKDQLGPKKISWALFGPNFGPGPK